MTDAKHPTAGASDAVREAALALLSDLDRTLLLSDIRVVEGTNASVKQLRAALASSDPSPAAAPDVSRASTWPAYPGSIIKRDWKWEPISTAPKSSFRSILLLDNGGGVSPGYFTGSQWLVYSYGNAVDPGTVVGWRELLPPPDNIVTLRAAPRPPQAGAGTSWQPIASAPKNGAQFLVTDGECVVIAEWPEALHIHDCTCHGAFSDVGVATHWQPLPPPPTAGTEPLARREGKEPLTAQSIGLKANGTVGYMTRADIAAMSADVATPSNEAALRVGETDGRDAEIERLKGQEVFWKGYALDGAKRGDALRADLARVLAELATFDKALNLPSDMSADERVARIEARIEAGWEACGDAENERDALTAELQELSARLTAGAATGPDVAGLRAFRIAAYAHLQPADLTLIHKRATELLTSSSNAPDAAGREGGR